MSQTRVRWTVRDLEVLPQSEGTYYELIDGELFVTRSPHRKHQQVSGKIYSALDAWSEESGLGEAIPSPGIIPLVLVATLTAGDEFTSLLLPDFRCLVSHFFV